MTPGRIAAIVAVALLAVLLAAVTLVWLLFDPNDYKGQLQGAFREATGRELRLDGPLSLSFFPWLAVETGAAAVSNRPGFGDAPFASLERARLGIRIWPLIASRRLELGPVEVDGLGINLAVARDGRNNWSDLFDHLNKREPPGQPAEPSSAPADFGVARIELRGAALRFEDAQARTSYVIDDWNLETGTLRADAPIDVKTSLRAARNQKPLGDFELSARVDPTQPDALALEAIEGRARLAREDATSLDLRLGAPRITLANTTRDISIEQLEIRLGEALLRTSLTVRQSKAGPHAHGTLELDRTDPRALLAALGVDAPQTRDAQALRALEARSNLDYSAKRGLQLEALDVTLDGARLRGRLGIADLSKLPVRFDLRGDTLDVDRYLSPSSKAPSPPPAAPPKADVQASRQPWDVAGSLALGKLVVAAIPLSDVTMQVKLRAGRFALDPLRARAFGGRLETRLRYDFAAAAPSLQVDQTLSGVDVAAMLGQLIDVRQLQGRGNATFSLATHGTDAQALFANLRGPFKVEVTDGALIGTDLWYEIERAIGAAQLKSSALTTKSSGRTEFQRLAANGTLAERTLRNERVEFVTDFARVHGHGNVDYGRDQLDLDLVAELLRTPPGRVLGVKVSRVQGAQIPIHVGGTLKSPQVRPDVSKVLEAAAKDAIKKPLDDELRKQLDKLFKKF